MIVIQYCCGHSLAGNIPERQQLREIEKSAQGEKCPECRMSERNSQSGQVRSPAKRAAGKRNLSGVHKAQQKNLKPCNCGRVPHRSGCPVYQREFQAKKRAGLN